MRSIIVAVTVVILALIVAAIVLVLRRASSRDKAHEQGWALNGDLTKAQEETLIQEVRDARKLCLALLSLPQDLYATDITILSKGHRQQITQWLSHSEGTLKKLENSK